MSGSLSGKSPDEDRLDLIERVKYQIDCNGETNDWEDEFLESVLKRLVNGGDLTPAQIRKLEEIEYVETNGRDYHRGDF